MLTEVYGCVVVDGPSPFSVVAFTSTGIAAPVLRLKTRCPRTTEKQISTCHLEGFSKPLTAQQASNLARMRSHRDIRAIVIRKHIVEDFLRADVLIIPRLSV